jgi:hypothetical protein
MTGPGLARLRQPGARRRSAILLMVIVVIATCAALAVGGGHGDVAIALEILVASVLGFSLVAFISFDAALAWRCVDFPWVCASFAAITVALININAAALREQVLVAKSEISKRFSDLIYAVQSTVTNDCQDLPTRREMWTPAPEPYRGACDRMKRFLPQMVSQYDEFSRSSDLSGLRGWAMNMLVPQTQPTGSWAGLTESAKPFLDVSDTYGPILSGALTAQRVDHSSILHHLVLTTGLRYWYFIMAFFVGLRVSKTTAEVLQARATALKVHSR